MEDEYNKNMKKLTEREKQIVELIQERRERAIENKIFEKILKTINVLGDTIENGLNSQYLKYQDTTFTLSLESDFFQVDLEITPVGHDFVFRGRSDGCIKRIDLYIPDKKWEDHLIFLYKKALATEKIQELHFIESEQESKMRKWKITEEDLF